MVNGTFVGLDVHKETTAVAVLHPGTLEPHHRVIATTPDAYRKLVRSLHNDSPVYCYEAGPCGFDPYRMLHALGAQCDVIAPTLIPRRSGRKVKTDRIDARNLARLHRAGELTAVRVPTPEEEAIRDLVRVREDIKAERRRAIQRLKSFLLRHGCRYPAKAQGWSEPYENWLRRLRMDQPCAQEALDHMIATAQARHAELRSMDRRIDELAGQPPLAEAVSRLRALKGIDTLTTATISAEVGDFAQFGRAPSFMAFVGLVPASTPRDRPNDEGRSQRPATHTSDGSWSRRRGPTSIARLSVPSCAGVRSVYRPSSWRCRGQRSCGCMPNIESSWPPSPRPLPSQPWPENSRASCGP